MVKKYVSLVLIGLLVIHLAGFYVYLMVRLGDIRMNMREKLETAQLAAVQIPAHQFRASWLDEREMNWMGNMYDIARVEQKGDFVIVYCIPDKDEENLLSFISAVINMGSQDTRPAPLTVTQFFTLKFVVSDVLCTPIPIAKIKLLQSRYSIHVKPVTIIPVTPPPRG